MWVQSRVISSSVWRVVSMFSASVRRFRFFVMVMIVDMIVWSLLLVFRSCMNEVSIFSVLSVKCLR